MSNTTGYPTANLIDIPWWTPENRSNVYPSATFISDGRYLALQDRTFVRLQDVTLSYTLRRSLLERLGGFDVQWKICADLDLFLRAKESGAVFRFVDREITDFALGGVSTVRRRETASEVRRILLKHGFGRVFAHGYYLAARSRACAAWAVRLAKGS